MDIKIENCPVKVEIIGCTFKRIFDELKNLGIEFDKRESILLDFGTANRVFEKVAADLAKLDTFYEKNKPHYERELDMFTEELVRSTEGDFWDKPWSQKTQLIIHVEGYGQYKAQFDFGKGEYKNLDDFCLHEVHLDVRCRRTLISNEKTLRKDRPRESLKLKIEGIQSERVTINLNSQNTPEIER